MPYRALRCQYCRENDSWFSVMYNKRGIKLMQEHFLTEHDEELTDDQFEM